MQNSSNCEHDCQVKVVVFCWGYTVSEENERRVSCSVSHTVYAKQRDIILCGWGCFSVHMSIEHSLLILKKTALKCQQPFKMHAGKNESQHLCYLMNRLHVYCSVVVLILICNFLNFMICVFILYVLPACSALGF